MWVVFISSQLHLIQGSLKEGQLKKVCSVVVFISSQLHLIQGSLKEGQLKKECSGGRLWNTRYFVLHSDRIVYYKTVDARPPPAVSGN